MSATENFPAYVTISIYRIPKHVLDEMEVGDEYGQWTLAEKTTEFHKNHKWGSDVTVLAKFVPTRPCFYPASFCTWVAR